MSHSETDPPHGSPRHYFGLVAASVLASRGVIYAPTAPWIGMTGTMLLVGLTEKMTFRSIVLVGARRAFSREWVAVVVLSTTFGLFNLSNTILV